MNPQAKAEWLAALRGDKYQQGSGCLRNPDGEFCCLGVAEDISPVSRWAGLHAADSDGTNNIHLTSATARWMGLETVTPTVTYAGEQQYLAELNDSGVSFAVIADLIEEQL